MSARLRLGEFLSSPVCTMYGDRDMPDAEADTLQSGLGQEQTFGLKYFRISDKDQLSQNSKYNSQNVDHFKPKKQLKNNVRKNLPFREKFLQNNQSF